jgi:dipeptidyl aminopeptidase/acylaminoacyl peptidase
LCRARLAVAPALVALVAATFAAGAASDDQPAAASAANPRPITLADGIGWKNINAPALSPDGKWVAYRWGADFAPGEVVVHATGNDVEMRWSGGEPPRTPVGAGRPPERGAGFSFSEDSKYFAWLIFPEHDPAAGKPGGDTPPDPARKAAKERKLGIAELAGGEFVTLEAVASYAFSGDRADWIAVHKSGDERGRGRRGAPGAGPGAADEPKDEHPGNGSDLLLRQLATGSTLVIGHVTEYAFDESGRFLAWCSHPEDETAAGVHLRDLETGVVRILASGGHHYAGLRWLEHGDALAFLEGRHDAAWKQDLYTLWGFSGLAAGEPLEVHWDPASEEAFPAAMGIHPSERPHWLEDRSAIVFGLRKLDTDDDAKKDAKDAEKDGEQVAEKDDAEDGDKKDATTKGKDQPEKAGLVIWHWRDERLPTQQRVEEQRDRDRSLLAVLRVPDRTFVRLADDDLSEVALGEDDRYAIGVDRRRYELEGTLDGRRYQDVWAIDPRSGERFLVAEKLRWLLGVNPQGDRVLFYRDRAFWSYDLSAREARNLTASLPTTFVDEQNDHNVIDPPVLPPGWSEDGRTVLLADNWDIWRVPVTADGAPAARITPDGKERGIRYRRAFQLDPEDEGLDLADPLYIGAYGDRTKKGGLARLRPGADRTDLLLWEDASFQRLLKAEKAPILAFSKESALDYPDLWVTDQDLQAGRRLTNGGTQREGLLWSPGRMLVDYKCAKGEPLQASLQLPANYEKGHRYPTVVYIYERMSPMHNRFYPPEQSGFSAAAYTSNGYAVLLPDIRYHVNDPGMSAAWCVLPALEAAVRTGVVDPEHVGLHGHSWGGYQTAFLVTQTDKFSAAVAGAPLTDLVSMYSSIYWNTGSANQPIFESSQGRFTGDFLDQPDAYLRNSPVFQARKVATPLMILHNDKDGAVDFNQGIEYFNILRRLRKPVVMLQYEGENHGLAKAENQRDYAVRMREFFDHHLKGEPAPPWLADGVRRLDLERHLEQRAREIAPGPVKENDPPAAPSAPADGSAPAPQKAPAATAKVETSPE